MSTSRHHWSWRSCFALVTHNKKSLKQENHQSERKKLTVNGHKHQQKIDENSNILCDFDESSDPAAVDEYNTPLNGRASTVDIPLPTTNDEDQLINDFYQQFGPNSVPATTSNQKSLSTVRSTPLDAIVEESNEENTDESHDANQSVRLCCDRDIIADCHDLYSRLLELSKMNHIVIQLNDYGYLYGEFTRHISRLSQKIDALEQTSSEVPRDAELLEARYSTLLATIENLALLLKLTQISSARQLTHRLVISIEQRMEQLNKLVQLTSHSSANLRQQRQDLSDDDFLSFRSAFSSYEHLLTMSS